MIYVGLVTDDRLSLITRDTVTVLTPSEMAYLLTEMIVKCEDVFPINKTLTAVIEDEDETTFEFNNGKERLVFTRNLTVRHERTLDKWIRLTKEDVIIIVRTLNSMFDRVRPYDWNEVKLNVNLEGGETK